MRVLHVPHAYDPAIGGAEVYVKRLSEGLRDLGHEVSVVTADLASAEGFYQLGVGPAQPPLVAPDRIRVSRLPARTVAYRLASLVKSGASEGRMTRAVLNGVQRNFSARLAATLGSVDADVVMTLPHLFANVRAVIAAHDRQPFPLVMAPMLHESDPFWPHKEMTEALGRANAVLALTQHEAQRLTDSYAVPAERVFVCPPGADISTSVGVQRNPQRVLYLGRKASNKGLQLLLRAMHQVWKSYPEAELVLAGSASAPGKSPSWESNDSARIIDVDDPTEAAKERLLGLAGVVVLPSSSEAFGIVLLEAMAHETPVIAIDTPVTREVVKHGETGLLTEGSPDGLANAIEEMIGAPEAARRMGTEGRRWVGQERTWERASRTAEEAYQHAISSFGASTVY